MFAGFRVRVLPALFLITSVLILAVLLIVRRKRTRRSEDGGLGGFGGLRDELAHAAESGGSVHISLGSGGAQGDDAMVSLAGLRVAAAFADVAVSYGLSPTVSVGDPTLLPLAQDALLRIYQHHRIESRLAPDQVRFVSPWPVAFGAGVGHEVASEERAVVIVAGSFGVEVTLVNDAAGRRGTPPFVAVSSLEAIGAAWAATDRLAPGEALFATAAQESGDVDWSAGVAAQDVLRVVVVVAIVVAGLWALLGG